MRVEAPKAWIIGGFSLILLMGGAPHRPSTASKPTRVHELLYLLGESRPSHALTPQIIRQLAAEGEQWLRFGRLDPSSPRLSPSHVCVDCHGLDREDPNLSSPNPEVRLAYLREQKRPLLQGTTLYGTVNKEHWYNGYWEKYRNVKGFSQAQDQLRQAIQFCSEICARGRRLSVRELDSILAFLWTRSLTLKDIGIGSQKTQAILNSQTPKPIIRSQIKRNYKLASSASSPSLLKTKRPLAGKLKEGGDIYQASCLHCHNLRSDSPAGELSFSELQDVYGGSDKLLRLLRRGKHTPGQRPYMPEFVPERLSDRQITSLALYIKHKAGSGLRKQSLDHKALSILDRRCSECHGPRSRRLGPVRKFDTILRPKALVLEQYLVPGDPERSPIYVQSRPENGRPARMPKNRESLTELELKILYRWIKSYSPKQDSSGWLELNGRLGSNYIKTHVRKDLVNGGRRASGYRYFSFVHLAQTGVFDDTYPEGLNMALNSVSWASDVVKAEPIDPEQLIYRIHISDLKWTKDDWRQIQTAYRPYAPYARQLAGAEAGAEVVVVSADWFAANALRGELYQTLARIPHHIARLEKRLGVDRKQNIRSLSAVRAGFKNSGVSQQNRLIERHSAKYGAYWLSYDFSPGGAVKGDIFRSPLGGFGSNGPFNFQHAGGEIIFHLPNGFQAYMLVDDSGKRLDGFAPPEIVLNREKSEPIDSGLSCMYCHGAGLIEESDEVFEVVKSTGRLPQKVLHNLKLLHNPSRLRQGFEHDQRRYEAALAAAGVQFDVLPPQVSSLAERHQESLNLERYMAELGISGRRFESLSVKSPYIQAIKNELLEGVRGISRDVFEYDLDVVWAELGYVLPKKPPRAKLQSLINYMVTSIQVPGRNWIQKLSIDRSSSKVKLTDGVYKISQGEKFRVKVQLSKSAPQDIYIAVFSVGDEITLLYPNVQDHGDRIITRKLKTPWLTAYSRDGEEKIYAYATRKNMFKDVLWPPMSKYVSITLPSSAAKAKFTSKRRGEGKKHRGPSVAEHAVDHIRVMVIE